MTTITLPSGFAPAIRHRVYVRSSWSGAWVLLPGMQCVEATWSVAPTIPTATIIWRYGPTKQPDQLTFFPELPVNLQDVFVRIEFECDDSTEDELGAWSSVRRWHGVVRSTEDHVPGGNIESGLQVYHAVGLEHLLAEHLITTTTWYDGSMSRTVEFPHVMNPGGTGNRTAGEIGATYQYYYDLDSAEHWSTRDIVSYLLRFHTPRDESGDRQIPFSISPDVPAGVIPDWDNPEVDPRGQTTYSVIDRLVSRDRLLSWWLDVSDTGDVFMFADTIVSAPLPVPVGEDTSVPANSRQREIIFDSDNLTTAAIKASTIDTADRVVCRGARRISVGTFNISTEATLSKGWTDGLEEDYIDGFSNDGGYSALSRRERQRRNQEVRSNPKFAEVFSRFLIPINWSRETGDGEGGTLNPFYPIETPTGTGPIPYPVYPPAMEVQPYLPLIVGIDYTPSIGSVVIPESDLTEMEPLVAFQVPGTSRWVQAEKIGQNAKTERVNRDEPTFSIYSTVFRGLRGIMLRVSGAPQHVIAGSWFVPLADDPDPGDYDVADAIFTLAIPDDRFAQGQYPPDDVALDPTAAVRVKYIDAGDQYRRDYLVPGTVVGVNDDGTLARSGDGGAIVNDEEELSALARIAYAWYGVPRNVLAIETARSIPQASLNIGDYITAIGTPETALRRTVASGVSQISVRVPVGTGVESDAPVPRWRIVTAAGELDPLQVVPRAMTTTAKREVLRERERMRLRGVMRGTE